MKKFFQVKNKEMFQNGFFVIALIIVVLFTGCARIKQARGVQYSGFLDDYSMLSKGKKGDALFIYRNPKADRRSYDKILLDPVVFYQRVEHPEQGAPQEDIQRMINNFNKLLYTELSKDYEMVNEPGPRTMRIQVALTSVEKASAALHTVSSVMPVGWVVSGTKDFVTGRPSFVGEASVEIKIKDARTRELLAAAVDRRVGGRRIKGSVNSWSDANKIFELWSKILRFRLCESRGGTDCLNPEG